MNVLMMCVALFVVLKEQSGAQGLPDLDFAIPESPAFQLIGVDGSKVLRPATVRELAVQLSGLSGGGALPVIPKEFALEIAPLRLFTRDSLDLKDVTTGYSFLNRFRTSIATKNQNIGNVSGPIAIAVGFRFNFLDDADLRTAASNRESADGKAGNEKVNTIKRDTTKVKNGKKDSLIVTVNIDKIPQQVDTIDKKGKTKHDPVWNNTVLDVAIGVKAISPDSTGKNMKYDNLSAWVTGGRGFTQYGMLLLTGNAENQKTDDGRKGGGSIAFRAYMGNNDYKMYFDLQRTWNDREDGSAGRLFGGGFEAKVRRSVWFVVSTNGQKVKGGKTEMTTSFKLSTGLTNLTNPVTAAQ